MTMADYIYEDNYIALPKDSTGKPVTDNGGALILKNIARAGRHQGTGCGV
jgi:hypothetical protein